MNTRHGFRLRPITLILGIVVLSGLYFWALPTLAAFKASTALGTKGGEMPLPVSASDTSPPGIANLAPPPEVLKAVQAASREAEDAGITLVVNSGWRSHAYHQQLLDESVKTHGSNDEAAKWVATPASSGHVQGLAVDIGYREAADWLAIHGSQFGLCRIFDHEPWHFELRSDAIDSDCLPTFANAREDGA